MNSSKSSYLTEEPKIQREGMSNTFEWDSREKNRFKAKWIHIEMVRELYPHLLNN